jgi:hypothetical protein
MNEFIIEGFYEELEKNANIIGKTKEIAVRAGEGMKAAAGFLKSKFKKEPISRAAETIRKHPKKVIGGTLAGGYLLGRSVGGTSTDEFEPYPQEQYPQY